MKSFYIYNFSYKESRRPVSATVIFCPGLQVNTDALQGELKTHYQNYFQAEKTVIIGGNYLTGLADLVASEKEKIFKFVPCIEENSFYNNLHVLTFDDKGNIADAAAAGIKPFSGLENFKKLFLHHGLQEIFVYNEGLVTSTGSHHHFVFPSGKHSDRFLRVANVLLYSSEIYFIAFALLKHFVREQHKSIYCDTSSINSVALALIDLLNRLHRDKPAQTLPVVSFKSYEGLYKSELNLQASVFIIISASTSGGMLDFFLSRHRQLSKANIVILYFLENSKPSPATLEQVACNLTKTPANPEGIDPFPTPSADICPLCKLNSFAVEVSGDVFLLEKPKVNRVTIKAEDMDLAVASGFVNQFMSLKHQSSFLKVNYKETNDDTEKKYEIYIDYAHVLNCLSEPRLKQYRTKLNAYIDQYVPSNLRYILHLNDNSSEGLSRYILDRVKKNYTASKLPEVVSQHRFDLIKKGAEGAVLIVGSCISNGKNLLYLSRALRDYKLRIIYFMGINRSPTSETHTFLRSNLKYGSYGSENSTFVEVEKLHCSSLSVNNAWQTEVEFLKHHIDAEDNLQLLGLLKQRRATIENAYSDVIRGMNNGIFLPRVYGRNKREELKIRRNSAFFNRPDYASHVSQSDVYFTIAYVLNKLRTAAGGHTLKQSMFVRNLISPENFNRFNDGIIQASILRNAKTEELNYAIDEELSIQVRDILITVFKYYKQEQGEAMLEFLYALAIKKMRLKKVDLLILLNELKNIPDAMVGFFRSVILKNIETERLKT